MNSEVLHSRRIRSFAKRSGKLTQAQKEELKKDFSDYKLPIDKEWDLNKIAQNQQVAFEIGFGNGDNLIMQAQNNPDKLFIGIEVYTLGIYQLLRKAATQNIKNIKVAEGDAVEILQRCVPDASLSRLVLLFPDPWRKKRHHKRRIVQPNFAQIVAQKLKDGGTWQMATDWQNYAEYMLEVMEMCPEFINRFGVCNFAPNGFERVITKFEQRGIKLGHNVWDLIYDRKNRA